jgi:hypothetical protein
MSTFDWLLVGHLVGDFLFQSDRMAQKEHRFSALGIHVLVYSLVQGVLLAFLAPSAAVWAACVGWLLVTHALLDTRRPVRFWMRALGVSADHPWLSIVFDQVFHVVTLVPVAVWLDRLGG